jgi:hypothetical protein
MIELLALAHGKRGRFFAVERAAGSVIRTGFFERHVTLDHVHDVEAIEQILNKTFWNHPSPRGLTAEHRITWCGESTEKTSLRNLTS